ncbi:mitochondrial import inner membrane translocase subunit TIM44-like isoform X1 [Dreissena polymorpha]|uniref:Mitochondrial import inner membrane translocase subunit TIM44 n=1 Tax=Dreissena polymorpha TaxID=45954 RepID=A0A9D4KKU1_DREPO|nr:mitochondrial import inner membrane translocase subunit TIM44-like isoform X1 [Dreissena polymorpha]KAH3841344.1 hypothetical protein DPMN_114803 [Dreissena polymorpha]
MASMWKIVGRTRIKLSENTTNVLGQHQAVKQQGPSAHVLQCTATNYDTRLIQKRQYSDGRKGFFQSIFDNMKEGFAKDKKLNENIKKFQEEKKKLDSSDAIKAARQKFENIESETLKGSDALKKKLSETYEELSKSEYVKKSIEITSDIGKTAGKAGEAILEQGRKIGESAPMKTVSQGVSKVREGIDGAIAVRDRPYKAPEKLWLRTEKIEGDNIKILQPDNETIGITLHKDSKWKSSWQDFKDNNEYVNKIFDLKAKYDESDNAVIRGTRFFTDKISSIFGGMFSSTEMSDVLTEINKMDPTFEISEFVQWCQYFVIPNILEALSRGEDTILKDWCYEAPFNQLMHPIKEGKKIGLRLESQILDISGVDVAAAKIMEQGPVLVISFVAQQILVERNTKGEVVAGDPNKVMRTTYVWAMCRDTEELNPRAAWRLLDFSAQSTEQLF